MDSGKWGAKRRGTHVLVRVDDSSSSGRSSSGGSGGLDSTTRIRGWLRHPAVTAACYMTLGGVLGELWFVGDFRCCVVVMCVASDFVCKGTYR